MKRRTTVLITVLGVLVFLMIAAGAAFYGMTRRPFPTTSGTISVPGLDAPVEIIRDSTGVPHIYAETQRDLYFAQGYVHAQDRFWQMEFWRRLGAGRLSELFGETTFGTDRFIRTMGFPRVAREELDLLPRDALDVLEAYAAGVNGWINDRKPGQLGLEFSLLKLQGVDVQIEPWQPVHTLTWLKIMAYDLGGNLQDELDRIALIRRVGLEKTQDFYPQFRDEIMPYIITDEELARFMDAAGLAAMDTRDSVESSDRTRRMLALSGIPTELVGGIQPGSPLAIGKGGDVGSNSWVISGDLTESGHPILANDPHLGIQMPSIWHEVALHGPKMDVAGFSFAGVPGVIVGHNQSIAWGVTNVNPDVQDLYVERINPDDPYQYEVGGSWRDMAVRYEEIQVQGEDEPRVLIVRKTRHGPIVTDTGSHSDQSGFRFVPPQGVESAQELAPPGSLSITELSLRWTALEPNRTFQAVLLLNRAQDFQDFREAASLFDIPSQNLVYADAEGNIGYQLPGRIPIRRNHDGRLPVPGWTDEYEWEGFIPFDDLPYVLNPEKGYVVTANQPVVSSDYPYLIHRDYNHGYRAKRIEQLIVNAPGLITPDYVAAMHGDTYNLSAMEILPALLAPAVLEQAVVPEVESGGTPEPGDWRLPEAAIKAAIALLAQWDFVMRADGAAPAVYAFVWQALLHETFGDEIPEELWKRDRLLGGTSRIQSVLALLLEEPNNPWWDNVTTPEVMETRDDILAKALATGYTAAIAELGDRPSRWNWGNLHTATFESQTFGSSGIAPIEALFNRGPVAVPGGLQQVNATDYSLTEPFEVVHVPSMRQIFTPNNWNDSRLMHTTGQSGHPYHRHYDDFIDSWAAVEYHDHPWSREVLEDGRTRTLRLVPGDG